MDLCETETCYDYFMDYGFDPNPATGTVVTHQVVPNYYKTSTIKNYNDTWMHNNYPIGQVIFIITTSVSTIPLHRLILTIVR